MNDEATAVVPKYAACATSRPSPATREAAVATAKMAVLTASRRRGGPGGGGGEGSCGSPVTVDSVDTGPAIVRTRRGSTAAVFFCHGQHSLPEEADPPGRARAPEEPPLHVQDPDVLPPPEQAISAGDASQVETEIGSSCRRSTRPSSAEPSTGIPAPARSPAPPACATRARAFSDPGACTGVVSGACTAHRRGACTPPTGGAHVPHPGVGACADPYSDNRWIATRAAVSSLGVSPGSPAGGQLQVGQLARWPAPAAQDRCSGRRKSAGRPPGKASAAPLDLRHSARLRSSA